MPPPSPEHSPLACVCVDFDGTVLAYNNGQGYIAPDVIAMLNELAGAGIDWCSNSGRTIEDQKRIVFRARDEGLRHEPKALMCSESFLFLAQEHDFVSDDRWNLHVCSQLSELHRRVQARIGGRVEEWASRYRAACVEIQRLGTAFLVSPEEACAGCLRRELEEAVEGLEHVLVNRNAGWVFISHRDLGKGAVLRTCAARLGWARGKVLTVGDNYNDLDMIDLRSAGLTGCPSDAVEAVQEAVRANGGYVAAAAGPAGTIEVIRHFLGAGPGRTSFNP